MSDLTTGDLKEVAELPKATENIEKHSSFPLATQPCHARTCYQHKMLDDFSINSGEAVLNQPCLTSRASAL